MSAARDAMLAAEIAGARIVGLELPGGGRRELTSEERGAIYAALVAPRAPADPRRPMTQAGYAAVYATGGRRGSAT